uniref:Uncharacterized protein n=1 Tax=viral metagenome TaxID=1070528 RepID=A0A6C0IEG1_9ZZZZ
MTTTKQDRKYDKMNEYVFSLFNVFKIIYRKAEKQKEQRMKAIALTIYNYVVKLSKDNNIDLNTAEEVETDTINLIPFFEYVSFYNIEFYDFKNIEITDVDINDAKDLERFVLSHVYYITQK